MMDNSANKPDEDFYIGLVGTIVWVVFVGYLVVNMSLPASPETISKLQPNSTWLRCEDIRDPFTSSCEYEVVVSEVKRGYVEYEILTGEYAGSKKSMSKRQFLSEHREDNGDGLN